jgi:integrase
VPVFTPHQIRHTYATELHRRYEDDELVAAAIGDTPEVARYVYVDDPADAAARRVAEAVG